MAGSIGTAYFNVAPNMSGVQGKITSGLKGTGSAFADQFGGEVNGRSAVIVGAIAGIASAATNKAMSILSDSISTAVKRVDTLNSAQKTFQYMGFAASDSAAAVAAVTKSIQGLPTPLDGAIRGMTSLAATYGDVKLGQKVFTALNDAILGFGGSADMVDNAIQQVSQLPLDGPLDAQTWMSLRNSGLTPVLVAMGKDMGKSVSQLKNDFGSGQLTVQDFVNELTKLDTQGGGGLVSLQKIALNATSGISTGFANMQTAVARGMANIIQAVGQKNISEAIAKIGAAFEAVLNTVAKAIPVAIGYIKGFFDFIARNKDIFLPIAAGAAGAAVALLAFAAASKVAAAISVITKGLAAAQVAMATFTALTGSGTGAMVAFEAVLAINPFVAIIVGVAAVTAALAYFFTQTETGKKIFGDITKALQPVIDAFKVLAGYVGGQLTSAFKSIGSIFQQLGQTLKPVTDAIGNFIQSIMKNKVVMDILKGIGIAILAIVAAPLVAFIAGVVIGITVLSKVLGFLADHFTVIKVILAVAFAPLIIAIAAAILSVKLIIAVVKAIPGVFSSVFGAVSKAVSAAFGAIAAVWNAVLKPVFDFMIAVITTIFNIYVKIWAAIALVILGTMAIIAQAVWAAVQGIWNVITTVFNGIWQFIQPILMSILGVFTTVWNAIYAVISSVIGWITGILVNAFNFYYGIISSVLGAIWGVISSVWNTIYGFLAGVFATISGLVSSAWNRVYSTISSIVGSIWNSVTGTFNSVVGFIGGVGGRILGALGNFGGLLYNAGRDLIQGLLNGAGSLLSSIGSFFLSKLPGWIQGPFKSALGIHSPSKVFAGFGANISQGLANGVADNASAVTGAISDLSDSAMSSFGANGLTADVTANANPAASGQYAAATGGGSVSNQDVTIGQVVLNSADAVKEWWSQLNQDTMNTSMGLTPKQGGA